MDTIVLRSNKKIKHWLYYSTYQFGHLFTKFAEDVPINLVIYLHSSLKMCSVSLGAKSDNKYLNRFLRWLRKGERSQEITSTRYQREQELAADQQRDKDTRDTNNYSTKLPDSQCTALNEGYSSQFLHNI